MPPGAVSNALRKWEFGDSASYSEWPKVADAVIEVQYTLMQCCELITTVY